MWLNAALLYLQGRLAMLAKDDRASVSVDFVVAIPILLAVLVFTSEYGRVLQMRTVLDNAVSDATRYLARAPIDDNTGQFPDDVVTIARQFITERINVQHVAVSQPVTNTVSSSASTSYDTVSLTVSIGVETPAISVISLLTYGEKDHKLSGVDEEGNAYEIAYRDIEGFVLTSTDTARHFGQ